ncbi:MAG: ABC transporter permease [Caldilineaceae bacterium]|nr:ABC transporter permease [Caldilineaceae bacterium]MCY4089791.1 ABC transporter permease [Caldilineaceae bacterium]MCY4115815.1 ABC transporter permease [Caldilineaceae bacterium]MDE0068952.1 ABC transporter permease [Caldilineaceae bacterium]MDE0182457.1 ABC transporter permease [Caldilineaceae bacterium]
MARYVARRLVQSLFVLVVVLTLVFFAGRVIGNPAVLILGPEARADDVKTLEKRFGYDQPPLVQFGRYARGVLSGDFGNSWWQLRPALPMALERLPATLKLAGVTMLFALPLAMLLGSLAAWRPGSPVDKAVNVISLTGASAVDFWIGLMLILLFAVQLRLLPTSGSGSLKFIILPALTLSLRPLGRVAQVTRSAMLDQLSRPYIKTARAKGFKERRIVLGQALKNAFIPIITLSGDEAISTLNGAVVVETVFAWPGLGLLIVSAVTNRDLPLIEALVFVVAVMIIVTNLLVDLTYSYLDPKVRFG